MIELTPRSVSPPAISARTAAALLALTMGQGCAITPHPWKDRLAEEPAVTTTSVRAASAADAAYEQANRGYKDMTRPAMIPSGALHGPTYFEDPFVDRECDDGRFAWTGCDLAYAVYGPARFGVNLLLAPVSMVVNPPWQIMESDGRSAVGDPRRFDAVPASSSRVEAEVGSFVAPAANPDATSSKEAPAAG